MSDPTAAIVPVKSAWLSKINWAQFVSVAATVAAVWGIDVPPETQVSIVAAIASVTAIVTWVLKTWFTSSVTASAVSGAPVVDQTKSVAAETPIGPVVNTVAAG